ncbi:MAG: ferritin [Chloroflexota bacterium]
MLSESVQGLMNEQIKHEIYSAHLYLSMAAFCDHEDWLGASAWLTHQYEEELEHARKFVNFVQDRNGRVTVPGIDKPPEAFAGLLDVFQQSLEHEQKVTGLINRIYDRAREENDYASQEFLNWFVNEQVEEEKMVSDILGKLKHAGGDSAAMLMIDRELGERTGATDGGGQS